MKHKNWAAAVGLALLVNAAGLVGVASVGGVGCGGKSSPGTGAESGAGAGSAAAPGAKGAKGGKLLPRTKRPIEKQARAFLVEVEKADDDPAGSKWLADAAAAVQALESGNPDLAQGLGAPPPPVLSALAALEQWAGSGEGVSIAERSNEMAGLFPAFRLVTALTVLVERSDDPRAATGLRFAKALRAPDNAAISIAIGSSLAAHWAKVVLMARKQPATPAFRDYAVTEADAMILGQAMVSESLGLARMITFDDFQREAHANGAITEEPPPRKDGEPGSALDPSTFNEVREYREKNGLPTKGDWVNAEFAAYTQFWDETESLVANAASPAELVEIFDKRIALAVEHPTSMLVRLVSGMVMTPNASQVIETCTDDAQLYAELLAGTPRK